MTATMIHVAWAHFASPLAPALLTNLQVPQNHFERLHVLTTIDPHTKARGLWINVYLPTSASPAEQHSHLLSISNILRNLTMTVDFVILGGDFNMSLQDLSANQPGAPTPSPLSTWASEHALTPLTGRHYTWSRPPLHEETSTIDFLFLQDPRGHNPLFKETAQDSSNDRHDHRVVTGTVKGLPVTTPPTIPEMTRPPRLKMSTWEHHRAEWQEQFDEYLESQQNADPIETLSLAVDKAVALAKEIIGMTTTRILPRVTLLSPALRHLQRKRKMVQIAVRHLHEARLGKRRCSSSLKKMWDEGILPKTQRATYSILQQLDNPPIKTGRNLGIPLSEGV
jgi:hypothetical protein